MRVEVHDQQVLGLSVGRDSFLRLQEVCDVVVVQQEAVNGALVNERLTIDGGEDFNRHGALVQGAAVHRAVPATPDQLRGTDTGTDTAFMWAACYIFTVKLTISVITRDFLTCLLVTKELLLQKR